jgi:hypothetical protein
MARVGRLVVPGFAHHVTQRGNRRLPVFFEPSDYALYRDLLAKRCRSAAVEVWAYCLMPITSTSCPCRTRLIGTEIGVKLRVRPTVISRAHEGMLFERREARFRISVEPNAP